MGTGTPRTSAGDTFSYGPADSPPNRHIGGRPWGLGEDVGAGRGQLRAGRTSPAAHKGAAAASAADAAAGAAAYSLSWEDLGRPRVLSSASAIIKLMFNQGQCT